MRGARSSFSPARSTTDEFATLPGFYAAEDYHQDYARLHPADLYIVINDAPKVSNLKREFPDLYRDPK